MCAKKHGIRLKKKFGQNFLQDTRFIGSMLKRVTLNEHASVFEIGGGSGVLTKAILGKHIARLWVFEIDPEWAARLQEIKDPKLTVFEQDFLDVTIPELFTPHQPWVLLANLPYQVSLPILLRLQKYRALISEGVVMVQEELAQKLVAKTGSNASSISHFFNWYFDLELLDKVPPTAFYPAPKVFSRLLYFKPKHVGEPTPEPEKFWAFVRACFKQPRRMLRNNLIQANYAIERVPEETLKLRAQQLDTAQLLKLWELVQHS